MSVKIYEAYRLPLINLNGFLFDIKEYGIARVENLLYDFIISKNNPNLNFEQLNSKMLDLINVHKDSGATSPFEFYLIVYIVAGLGDVFFLPVYSGSLDNISDIFSKYNVEEFGYWNNVDKPDNISEYDWKTRGEIWEYVSCDCAQLVYNITGDNSSLSLLLYDLLCKTRGR